MRTTVRLDDDLLRQAKASRPDRPTLTSVIEDDCAKRWPGTASAIGGRRRLPTFQGQASASARRRPLETVGLRDILDGGRDPS